MFTWRNGWEGKCGGSLGIESFYAIGATKHTKSRNAKATEVKGGEEGGVRKGCGWVGLGWTGGERGPGVEARVPPVN